MEDVKVERSRVTRECMRTRARHETKQERDREYTKAKAIVKGETKRLTVNPIRQHDSDGDHDLE